MSRAVPAAVFLAVFALLLGAAHPAFQLDDSPETAAAVANLSVQHAPGYPSATLAGRLALAIPAGGPYFRLNVLAAALAAGVAAACAAAVPALLPVPGAAAAGAVAGLAFAFLPQAWDGGLSGKGIIYSSSILLLMAALGLALRARATGAPRALAGSFLVFGIALAGHWMTAACLVPALLWLAPPRSAREWATCAFVAALGLSLYLQLPLSAAREPCWGDPGTTAGLFDILARRSFTPHVAVKPAGLLPLQLLYGSFAPLREGGVAFLLLAFAGGAVLWRVRRPAAVALAGTSAVLVAAVALATNPVHVVNGDLILWLLDRFYLPLLAAAAVAAGAGLAGMAAALPRPAGRAALAVAALLPAVLLIRNMTDRDHSRDFAGHDCARNMVAGLAGPSTILAEADYQCFPLEALIGVDDGGEGRRLVITNPFLRRGWGWRRLSRSLPYAAEVARTPGMNWDGRIGVLAERLRAAGPVYHLPLCTNPAFLRSLQCRGLIFEVLPPGARPQPPSRDSVASLFRRLRLRGLLAERPLRDPAALSVLDVYPMARAAPAAGALVRKDPKEALAIMRGALPWPGHFGRAMLLLSCGRMLAEGGWYSEAEGAFQKACRIRPYDPDSVTNLATARAAQGGPRRSAAAMKALRWVLDRYPNHASARANLAALEARLAGMRRAGPVQGLVPLP